MSEWIQSLASALTDSGPWGPAVFIAAYVIAAVTLLPAFLLTFMAGAVFGLWHGTLLVYLGAVLGASAVYALATPLAQWRVLRWIDRDPRLAVVRRAVVGEGLWIMFLLRLSPLVPFVFLNYALSLSGVRFADYLLASVGMLPAIVMYVYYGKVVGDVAALAAGASPERGPEYYVLLVVGLLATVAASTIVTRVARQAIQRRHGESNP